MSGRDLAAWLARLEWAGAIEVPCDLADDRSAPACPVCEGIQPGWFGPRTLADYELEEGHADACELARDLAAARAGQL